MLNKELFMQELQRAGSAIFSRVPTQVVISRDEWVALGELSALHDFLASRFKVSQISRVLVGLSTDIIPVCQDSFDYQVLAVDGSQLYHERSHNYLSCYLINAGGCFISYGTQSRAILFSVPKLCAIDQSLDEGRITPAMVDNERDKYEYSLAYERAVLLFADKLMTKALIFDGSLFPWHLKESAPEVRDEFVDHHLSILQQCKLSGIPTLGYVSLSKSKDLVRLLLDGIHLVKSLKERKSLLDGMYDAQLLASILCVGERTPVFESGSELASCYPTWLKPCFFYVHTGKEIARIEIPAWIAQDEKLVATIAALCIDQSIKGFGYPVALAEAHEQAVIKAADRDFFYHMVTKMGITQQQPITFSQKSIKKRGMSI